MEDFASKLLSQYHVTTPLSSVTAKANLPRDFHAKIVQKAINRTPPRADPTAKQRLGSPRWAEVLSGILKENPICVDEAKFLLDHFSCGLVKQKNDSQGAVVRFKLDSTMKPLVMEKLKAAGLIEKQDRLSLEELRALAETFRSVRVPDSFS